MKQQRLRKLLRRNKQWTAQKKVLLNDLCINHNPAIYPQLLRKYGDGNYDAIMKLLNPTYESTKESADN